MKSPLIYIPAFLALAAAGWFAWQYNKTTTDYEILQLKLTQKENKKQKLTNELQEVQATLTQHDSLETYQKTQVDLQNKLKLLETALNNQPDYATELLKLQKKKEELERKIQERQNTPPS